MKVSRFQKIIWNYYRKSGRHNLPWRHTKDAYKILISEVMLQQTQVTRVLKKYPEFLRAFPDFKILAQASLLGVLKVWQGMGYNRRALLLKRLAEKVVDDYGGKLPKDEELLTQLPGIGRATAGAIRAFAFDLPTVFIETNIRRVFTNFFFKNENKIDDGEIMELIQKTLPEENFRKWYWALMDYGAMLATNVNLNPNRKSTRYKRQSQFKGSNRELRGQIIAELLKSKKISFSTMEEKTRRVMEGLEKDGFLRKVGNTYTLVR